MAATGIAPCCESAGDGTAVGSLLDTGLDPFVKDGRLSIVETGRRSFVGARVAGNGVVRVPPSSGEAWSCVINPSVGARYCCLKLLAEVEGHAPCSEMCGLSGSS